jgi:hypothetical protein
VSPLRYDHVEAPLECVRENKSDSGNDDHSRLGKVNNISKATIGTAILQVIRQTSEFYKIIGKENINGEVHYIVSTLISGSILEKVRAQWLINSFEAQCQTL